MARKTTISDEQILEAARDVFLERGVSGTTAEIARRAGISEGSIFRRFPTKDELFVAALGVPEAAPFSATLEKLVGKGDLHRNLHQICSEILAFLMELVPNMIMLASSRMSPVELIALHEKPAPLVAIQALTTFIRREQELGRARRAEPELVARVVMGSLFHFAFAEEVGFNRRLTLTSDDYVSGVVEIVWCSLAPEGEGG